MPFDLCKNSYFSEYYVSIKYLFDKELGDYLSSFVNDLYFKSNLYSKDK